MRRWIAPSQLWLAVILHACGDGLTGNLLTVPLSGGAPTTLTPGEYGSGALAMRGDCLYWTVAGEGNLDTGAVMKLTLGCGCP
jgi:hypothetical protein